MMHFIVRESKKAIDTARFFEEIKTVSKEEASVFVVFGGDGFMLESIREFGHLGKPFYGVNCGHVGFLMNDVTGNLEYNVNAALKNTVHPLAFQATTTNGEIHSSFALNEVALMRHGPLASGIDVYIHDEKRITCRGDGLLLATPTGSTAYNASAGGPILPLGAQLLALTPLCVYSPKHWKGALLQNDAVVSFIVQTPSKRPVYLTYDNQMIQDVEYVRIFHDKTIQFDLLFDSQKTLESRILKEQFMDSYSK